MKWYAPFLAAAATAVSAEPQLSTPPVLSAAPHSPRRPFPVARKRSRTCEVATHGQGHDDSDLIMDALKSCNDGGHVVFDKKTEYTIGTALDLTFLHHVDLDIQGRIQFTSDTDYWQKNSFRFGFQNVTSFFKLGGEDIWIYGGGTIDGNGQKWYDLYAENSDTLRPVLFGIEGLSNSVISGLVWRNSPMYYSFVANSSNVVFDHIDISGFSTSKHKAKNTDGWDTYRSRDITIQNSVVNNGDDCVAFKPNSTFILTQSLVCNGSHGISVGSLGQYPGTYDIVHNILASNISMRDATDGARVKVWPNTASAVSGDLQGGGGRGEVQNVTFENFQIDNVDWAIEITQCYGQKNLTLCQEHPSQLKIEGVTFRNFKGVTSKRYSPLIASFECSSKRVCSNIHATDIDVASPDGKKKASCLNQDEKSLDVECVTAK